MIRSATQVDAFRRCKRLWYYGWVDKIRTPQTPSQMRGQAIHHVIEQYLTGGKYVPTPCPVTNRDLSSYAASAASHLPVPLTQGLVVEKEFRIPCGDDTMLGYVDWAVQETNSAAGCVGDNKTTSDPRYAKTPAELVYGVQMPIYGRWYFTEFSPSARFVDLGHVYLQTYGNKPLPVAGPKVWSVWAREVSRDQVNDVWSTVEDTVAEMRVEAKKPSAQDVDPTGAPSECRAYGGCPHRDRCGLQDGSGFNGFTSFGKSIRRGGGSMSFMEKLKKMKEAAAAQGAAGALAPSNGASKVEVPMGVLAPDAAPRTSAPVAPEPEAEAEQESPTSAPAKRKRRTKAEMEAARAAEVVVIDTSIMKDEVATEQLAPCGEPGVPIPTTAPAGSGFTLYLDCLVAKGASVEPTMFEDWVAPIVLRLDEENPPTYRMLPYAEEKAVLAAAAKLLIAERGLPREMVADTSSMLFRDLREVLVPRATKIVRGRGG